MVTIDFEGFFDDNFLCEKMMTMIKLILAQKKD